MNQYITFKSQAESIKGLWKFKSPYHKNKMLPFFIPGTVSFNSDFPIDVHTLEYRGHKASKVITSYKFEAIKDQIINGKLIPDCDTSKKNMRQLMFVNIIYKP